ncbi:MAG: HPr family phosphocarrier protein [Planctomycetales bacterium]|nr:HPr family phosphocarrier protein [Planctomycetales bacterium]
MEGAALADVAGTGFLPHNLLVTVAMEQHPACTREVTVNLENGLHLGPSSQIVQTAQKFGCELRIRKGERSVDGTSMLELLTLAAEHGTVLILETRGERAKEALAALVELFESNFPTAGSAS